MTSLNGRRLYGLRWPIADGRLLNLSPAKADRLFNQGLSAIDEENRLGSGLRRPGNSYIARSLPLCFMQLP